MKKEKESKITCQSAMDKIIESYLAQKKTWFRYQYRPFLNYLQCEPAFILLNGETPLYEAILNDETTPLAYKYYQLISIEEHKDFMYNLCWNNPCIVFQKETEFNQQCFEAIKEIEKLPEEDGINLIKQCYINGPVFLKNKAIMMQLIQSVKKAAENNEREINFRGVKFDIERFPCSDLISLVGEKGKITINTKNSDIDYEDFKKIVENFTNLEKY